ncbi:MAG: hypothetical protein WD771_11460 [Gemmatimonadaceae bacterium]
MTKSLFGRALLCAIPFLMLGATLGAQAHDPTAKLREVLPADVAERVIAKIEAARSRELPAAALENRALAFAARGVAPADIERAIGEHVVRMETARQTLETAIGQKANGEEIEAGAEAMRQGVDGAAVSALAQSAPSGRSLAVPLFVIGSLVERGLPSDAALQRVMERLQARASDGELEGLATVDGNRPEWAGRPAARPTTGRPETVPATGGRPSVPTRPAPAPAPGRP